MTSSYTPEVERIFRTLAPEDPRYMVDIAEYPDYPGLLFLQTYTPVVERLSPQERVQFSQQLWSLKDAIHMVTPCDIIMVDKLPPHRQVVEKAREKRKRNDL